jgi:hypothetical protein
MDVRERIRALDPKRVWAVEVDRTDLDQRKGASPFFIVDELIAEIRRSSLFITWGVIRQQLYLLGVFRRKLDFPSLKRAVLDLARRHQPWRVTKSRN